MKDEELSSGDAVRALPLKRLTNLLKFKDVSFNIFMSILCKAFLIHTVFIFTMGTTVMVSIMITCVNGIDYRLM